MRCYEEHVGGTQWELGQHIGNPLGTWREQRSENPKTCSILNEGAYKLKKKQLAHLALSLSLSWGTSKTTKCLFPYLMAYG